MLWDECYMFGVVEMDVIYWDFVEMVDVLLVVSDDEFLVFFVELYEYICWYFDNEGKLMKVCCFLVIGEYNSEYLWVFGELVYFFCGVLVGCLIMVC